jgi:hypothetical protein
MPSGTFHLNELDSDKITLDGTLSVSGASTLKGDVALSSNLTVAGDTALANTSASNVDVDGTLSVSGITTIGGHILPSVNDAFDIGSPEFLFILLEKNINITSIHYEKEIAKIALKSF